MTLKHNIYSKFYSFVKIRGVTADLANNIAWDALVPRLTPTLANMHNGSALVAWPWDAVP